MGDHPGGSLRAFYEQFRHSPVRWVVLVHVVLLMTVVAFGRFAPLGGAMSLLDASLVMAQVALLLIWMTLDGQTTIRRTFGVAIVVLLIQMIHTLPYGIGGIGPGIVCTVLSMFITLTVLALPLSIAHWTGMQLRRFTLPNMPPPRRLQFSIRSVLFASVIVAILFGLKGFPEMLDRQPELGGNTIGAALAIIAMSLIAAAVYLSIPLVSAWAVLTPGKVGPRLATAVVGWGLGAALVFHYTRTDQQPVIPLALPAISTAVAIVVLLATLLMLRALHYRVVWEKDGKRPAASQFPPTSPFAVEATVVANDNGTEYPGAQDGSHHAPP